MKNKETQTSKESKSAVKAERNTFISRFKGAFTKEKRNRVLKLLLCIVLILILTNPALIPFLPRSIEKPLVGALTSLFGNVSDIVNVIPINWIVLFKLAVMILLMKIVSEVCRLILDVLSPKSNRGKTLLNLVRSSFKYIMGFVGIFLGPHHFRY